MTRPPTVGERLNNGLRLQDDAEPIVPWHHAPDRYPAKGDECPKRARYVDEVVARLKRKRRGGTIYDRAD